MNCKDLTTQQKLDLIGKVVDQLVKTTDSCFQLTDKEKCLIAECAMGGITELFDRRYKAVRNKHRVYKEL
jgi:hypothetical protein